MAIHGYPRATGDLDLWVIPTIENSARVWQALQSFRAPLSKVNSNDFATPNLVFQIGLAPRRIDILTSIDGIVFEEAWPNRRQFVINNLSVPVLGLADLIKNKKATGRTKDIADVEVLENLGQ